MTKEKGPFLKDIQDGDNVTGIFLIREISRLETKNGKPYLVLTVMDRSGEMAGRVWDDADRWLQQCPAGSIAQLSGQAQAYKGVVQLKVNTLNAVTENDVDVGWLMPAAPGDPAKRAAELLELVQGVADPFLQKLLQGFFAEPQTFAAFQKAPAAKLMHHAYAGGLLEHSLAVARLAEEVSNLYPAIDRPLLVTAALLHDIGKMVEFSYDSFPFDYTDKGRLVGHLVLGVEMIQEKINAIADFPEALGMRLKHLILSHHGQHEFGSPSLPMTLEAFILNLLDDMDAKVNYIGRLSNQAKNDGYQWTEYQRPLGRFLFVQPQAENDVADSPAPTATPHESPATDQANPSQASLWK